ncbi:ectoine hydroxylase [Chromobacterium phragmitis]|uniref:Ectoine hydroxylase n=1 Tax=Chromobacterium phragmitis TaxID=2202141 RepID=A0A344UHV1_9NEIS|nr:ectoine hydroxylase [Chromobacterium phragmitis]AXE34849.1 ectoine hydroxylase [Chromobacterium phragmitis]
MRVHYPTRTAMEPAILKRIDPVCWPDAPVQALSDCSKKRFENDGFLQLNQLFNASEVQSMQEELARLLDDGDIAQRPETIKEPDSRAVRSIFAVHRLSALFSRLVSDRRLINIARELLADDVYIHQSRANFKPGFQGKDFYWHSDFETWHAEDGMPRMRAVSCSILLADNNRFNGPLLLVPGSHKHFISCVGETPDEHYKDSLVSQSIGVPDPVSLKFLVEKGGLVAAEGKAGAVVFFDCNTMHGSSSNISPYPRSNLFFVYNSVNNRLQDPFYARRSRPEYIAARDGAHPLPVLDNAFIFP